MVAAFGVGDSKGLGFGTGSVMSTIIRSPALPQWTAAPGCKTIVIASRLTEIDFTLRARGT